MQTHLSPEFLGTPDGEEAEAILRKCVHCGFCLATCPTYQLRGDELDSPRGRIYLMKQVLEGQEVTRKTQEHLDRCLTCRNCETTCPSGVEYGKLLDIGPRVAEEKVARPPVEKAVRWALAQGLPSPLFAPAMKAGQAVRGLLPKRLREKVPPRQSAGHWPTTVHARKVLLLAGCVQPSMAPNINGATARVLDAAGIQTLIAPKAGCCGAVKFHLNDQAGGKDEMRTNIDAWLPYLESGEAECIVMNASVCGVTVKEYGHLLRHDPAYADKAAKVSAATRDLSELLPELVPLLQGKVKAQGQPFAYHPPCTLQHGQQLRGGVEQGLAALGFELRLAASESHLCCGSAGTYSVLEPETAHQLRDRKLAHLQEAFPNGAPQAILSANIGCITHLQSGTDTPVRHWIEVLDEALTS